mmetsp:Transcript_5564/g.16350  ORF Transcript_5564/g.16350 Transcript_5564/m.16350 type:complete len:239 (+) Transcript_5564:387-1103(+)
MVALERWHRLPAARPTPDAAVLRTGDNVLGVGAEGRFERHPARIVVACERLQQIALVRIEKQDGGLCCALQHVIAIVREFDARTALGARIGRERRKGSPLVSSHIKELGLPVTDGSRKDHALWVKRDGGPFALAREAHDRHTIGGAQVPYSCRIVECCGRKQIVLRRHLQRDDRLRVGLEAAKVPLVMQRQVSNLAGVSLISGNDDRALIVREPQVPHAVLATVHNLVERAMLARVDA